MGPRVGEERPEYIAVNGKRDPASRFSPENAPRDARALNFDISSAARWFRTPTLLVDVPDSPRACAYACRFSVFFFPLPETARERIVETHGDFRRVFSLWSHADSCVPHVSTSSPPRSAHMCRSARAIAVTNKTYSLNARDTLRYNRLRNESIPRSRARRIISL